MKFANPSKKSRTLVSTRGHSIEFPGKGTAADPHAMHFVFVPPALLAEAISGGFIPESEIEEPPESNEPVRPEDPAAVKALVFKVFADMIERGEREEFAGNGYPKHQAVSKQLGWLLQPAENKDLWSAFQTERATEK